MKKIIGIIGRERKLNNKSFLVFYTSLVNQIYSHDCLPLGILLNYKTEDYKFFIDMCDGIILEGGNDDYDIDDDIIKYIYNKNIPVLGICLGMQLMGKALNGQIKSIGNMSHDTNEKYAHTVKLNENSKLYSIIQKNNITVNSHHTDYLVNTDLFISAISKDGIIEGIEDKNKNYFIGIQWHPECLEDENSKKIFDSFFNSVKKRLN